MKPEPHSRCFAFRLFPILCLLLLPHLAAAQSAGNYCEPSAAVKEEIKKVNNLFNENVPFKIWRERDTKNTPLDVFELTDLQGRNWSLADLKGKVAFINVWATWCGPCREELPYVQKLSEQLKGRTDVLVLTLNTDEEVGKVEPFMKEKKYSFPVLLGQTYADGNGVNSIPRNWVISADGKLAFEAIGFGGDGEEWLKKAVEMIEKVKGTP